MPHIWKKLCLRARTSRCKRTKAAKIRLVQSRCRIQRAFPAELISFNSATGLERELPQFVVFLDNKLWEFLPAANRSFFARWTTNFGSSRSRRAIFPFFVRALDNKLREFSPQNSKSLLFKHTTNLAQFDNKLREFSFQAQTTPFAGRNTRRLARQKCARKIGRRKNECDASERKRKNRAAPRLRNLSRKKEIEEQSVKNAIYRKERFISL